MNKKPLAKCQFFFIDSGVLIDLLKQDLSGSSPETIKRIEITNNFFNSIQQFEGKKHFQISAINIAEIFHVDNQDDTLKAIISVLNSQEIEIYSFDSITAIFHNKEFQKFLGNKAIAELKKSISYPQSKFVNIEDRIRKDYLIAATAKMYNTDVVLTNDTHFKEFCESLEIPCHLFTHDENQFRTNQKGDKILEWA